MTKKPTSVSCLLKHLAKAAERLTDDEIADVIAGRLRLTLTAETVTGRSAAAKESQDFSNLITSLKSVGTRDAAHKLIEDSALTRSQLTQLARSLDLPTQGNDNVARIQEKIVEATIGFRLTSSAIQKNG